MGKIGIFFLGLICIGCISCAMYEPSSKESSSKESSFTVNGTKVDRILYTLCEISPLPREMVLEVHFDYDDSTYSLDMALYSIKKLDGVKSGDKFEADDFIIYKFYYMFGVFIGSKYYEPISGSAIVKSVSESAVVIEYSNFKFLRVLGSKEETFTVDGTISYTVNDWES